MIKLTKHQEMIALLKALKISDTEYTIKDYYIELRLNPQQIFYRIGAAYKEIHHVHDTGIAWKELIEKAGLEGVLNGK